MTGQRYLSAFCGRSQLLSLNAKSADWFLDKFKLWIRPLISAWDIKWDYVEEQDGEIYWSLRKTINKIQEVQWMIWGE